MEIQQITDMMHKFTHDIKSPMSVIKSFLNIIEGTEMDPELRELYEATVRSVKKVEIMINTMEESGRPA